MNTRKAIAYIPEFQLDGTFSNKLKLTSNLRLLPENNRVVEEFKKEINEMGYTISGGSYLYFEGDLRDDGTLYEIFQGYALALTFFSPKGRTTCRAIRELVDGEIPQLFIDEYDKFGYEKDDVIVLKRREIKLVQSIYDRVELQLENKDFNPLRNSLEFFILFLSEKQIRTRLLYLSICLESVLLESENEGLSYKLGMRCANLLNAFYSKVDMGAIFEEIKNGYTLRSKIIHGDDYDGASEKIIKRKGGKATELDHVLNLETIVKDTLSVIFMDQNLYDLSIKKELGKEIDQRYILDRRAIASV